MRNRYGKEHWEEEKNCIVSVCTEQGVPANFNATESVFYSYVQMQSRFAYMDGFPSIAGTMRKAYNARNTEFQFTAESLWGV